MKSIQQLVEQHPKSAPALGYQAELLYVNGRPDDADDALQKAFAIDPDFPLGHWLRGLIRKDEGETIGALIQFRKAAELYDPKSNGVLAEIHAAIFDIEMRLNHPVAARASLEKAVHCDPSAEQLRTTFDSLFSIESRLPECARKAYTFRPASPARSAAWQATLPAKESTRLSEALAAFDKLTTEDHTDGAAWYNLGLVRAWMGDHPKAIVSLLCSIELDTDEASIAESGALIEVLRCGSGMEEQADYLENRIFFQLQHPEPLIALLGAWSESQRISGAESDKEAGTFSALVLEETPQLGLGVGAPVAKLGCYLFIVSNIVRLWSPNKDAVNKVADEVMRKLGPAVTAPMHEVGHCNFSDITVEAMLFPTREASIHEMAGKMGEQARNYFEEVWIQRPFKSLGGVSPVDAAAHPAYRKRLLGVVKFVEECFISSSPRVQNGNQIQIVVMYDFSRLRRQLGLAAGDLQAIAEPGSNIDTLPVAELAALDVDKLSDEQIDQAFRSALKLDARDLAGKFATHIVDRPTVADRYPYYNHLMQLAQAENDTAGVLTLLDRADKADAESNSGQRQNDISVKRGQVHATRGEVDKSYETFQSLLTRAPNDLKFYGPAIEAMLGQKKGLWALQFAEAGLAKARSQNNRDSEQYFMELASAAKKLVG